MPSTNSSARSWTPQSRMRQSDNSIKQQRAMQTHRPLLQLVEEGNAFFDKRDCTPLRASVVRQRRTIRHSAPREVFSATYTPPPKMIEFYFAAAAAKLCEASSTDCSNGRCRLIARCIFICLFNTLYPAADLAGVVGFGVRDIPYEGVVGVLALIFQRCRKGQAYDGRRVRVPCSHAYSIVLRLTAPCAAYEIIGVDDRIRLSSSGSDRSSRNRSARSAQSSGHSLASVSKASASAGEKCM